MMFHCTQCNRSFEAPEGPPRCPQCGSFLVEPQSAGVSPQPSAAAPGAARRPAAPKPSFSDMDGLPEMYAVRRVAGPATSLKVIAGLSVSAQALSLTRAVINTALGVDKDPLAGIDPAAIPADQAKMIQELAPYMTGFSLFFGLVGVLLGIVVFLGASHMRKLQSRGLAKTAAVLAVIPCTSPCCVLGIPLGIWALVVLSDPRVAAAFDS